MTLRPGAVAAALSPAVILVLLLGVTAVSACGDPDSSGEESTGTGDNDNDTGAIDDVDPGGEDAGPLADGAVASDDGQGVSDAGDAGCEGDDCADTSGADGQTSDTGAPLLDCPGGPGCDCAVNNDCDTVYCIDTQAGKKCAQACVTDCPEGFTCKNPGTSDAVFICMPNHLTLCAPCKEDQDCKFQGSNAICLDYGPGGSFCGSACVVDGDCPAQYGCIETKDGTTGQIIKQCKLKLDDSGEQPLCGCSKWATTIGAKSDCLVGNAVGTCAGERGCGAAGLTACDAPVAVTELCDTVDNDCDGITDNVDKVGTCSQKAWFDAGSKSACTSDQDCAVAGETCHDPSGTCRVLIGECFGTPICEAGGKLACKGIKTPKAEMCNGEDDDCDAKVDEDFHWLDPTIGTKVAIGGGCGHGVCASGTVKCDTLSAAVCDAEKLKSSEVCDGDDNDCDGEVDEKTCDDGSACTKDECDAANASCSNPAAVECDDKNVCTKDSCDGATGDCVFTFSDASCDDGDACTVGDVCKQGADGVAACLPGATTQACDDDNVCTDDSCAPDSGCVNLANAATVLCYSAISKDSAGEGLCKSGTQFCKEGKLEFACVGEVLPKLTEACDGVDDDCDGKTDEGCKSAAVVATFATAWGSVGVGGGMKATVELGGTSPSGKAAGKSKTAEFGFLTWVLELLKKQ